MSSPAINNYFDPAYDRFSISSAELTLPHYYSVYDPDPRNQADFHCLSVICPSPELGATRWTVDGKWITIGIYRDEGRPTAPRPLRIGISWTRVGSTLYLNDPNGHCLEQGDYVDLTSVNVGQLNNRLPTIIDKHNFSVTTWVSGGVSGFGSYTMTNDYNFSERRYVFRLLPSFKLVPWSVIQAIFKSTEPRSQPDVRSLYNITRDLTVNLPRGKTSDVNYDVLRNDSSISLALERRFDQQYDEGGEPLKIKYRNDGLPIELHNYDEIRLNDQIYFNQLPVNPIGPSRVSVYDYYGFEINDITRAPYWRSDLITRNLEAKPPINNISVATNNFGEPLCKTPVFDVFGDLVIGIQENNATVVRRPLLPLKLDVFNRPVKAPKSSSGQLALY